MFFDSFGHHTTLTIYKWWDTDAFTSGEDPYEEREHVGNILTSGGVTAIWNLVAGNGSSTAFSTATAYIGVGDSTTATLSGHTDLLASSNKLRKAVLAGSPGVACPAILYTALFGASEANYAWNEFAVFNASVSGVMLNRAIYSGGTKTTGQVWAAIVQIGLS